MKKRFGHAASYRTGVGHAAKWTWEKIAKIAAAPLPAHDPEAYIDDLPVGGRSLNLGEDPAEETWTALGRTFKQTRIELKIELRDRGPWGSSPVYTHVAVVERIA